MTFADPHVDHPFHMIHRPQPAFDRRRHHGGWSAAPCGRRQILAKRLKGDHGADVSELFGALTVA
jgi:hypothetical protein